jgi:flagellar hook-associated protein 3 FlgL
MRVTQAMMFNDALLNEANVSSRLAQLTQQASSGLAVSQPSDDPAAYASIQQQDAEIGVVQARSQAASLAAGNMNLAESTLDAASNLLVQAKSIAIEASNGTQDASSRADSASQVSSIFQQLLALANTKGTSGYLFGGTASETPPFDPTGAFQGNSGVTQVAIADGVLATSSASGADAFTAAGGTDVFATVQALQTALTNNDVAGIQTAMTALDSANTQLIGARVDAGTDAGRLSSAATAMTTALAQMQTNLAGVADADAPTTLSNLQATQTAYEAAIEVNKQVLSTAAAGFTGGG